MKNYEHPEYLILHELQNLQEEHPDISKLNELVERLENIINENAISMYQHANLYALLGRKDDLRPDTKEKITKLLNIAKDHCEQN